MNRIKRHPILGDSPTVGDVTIYVDGKPMTAHEGDMIAAALLANGVSTFRYTAHKHKPRGLFCGIGRCTDCVMVVDGIPNVRTCITPVRDGMQITTQQGAGEWQEGDNL